MVAVEGGFRVGDTVAEAVAIEGGVTVEGASEVEDAIAVEGASKVEDAVAGESEVEVALTVALRVALAPKRKPHSTNTREKHRNRFIRSQIYENVD